MYRFIDHPEQDYTLIIENDDTIGVIEYSGYTPDTIHFYKEPEDRPALDKAFRQYSRDLGCEISIDYYTEV